MSIHALIGATAVAAIFTEAGNGANFSVVPHVHPNRNGIVSGLTGAFGNLGGIVFNLVFRFEGTNYHKAYWIIGVISLLLPLCVCWIPVPKVRFKYLICANHISFLANKAGWANLVHTIYRLQIRRRQKMCREDITIVLYTVSKRCRAVYLLFKVTILYLSTYIPN